VDTDGLGLILEPQPIGVQMGLSNRSPLIKSFIEIARRCHCRSFDGSRTEGIAIALLVLLDASDGRVPGAWLSSRSTPVRRMMVFAGVMSRGVV
jgi:hypothetical protein